MGLTSSLIGGVISSLIAVAIVEIYRVARKKATLRSLRQLLSNARRVGIAMPDFPLVVDDRTGSLLSLHDAIALAHVLEASARIGAETVITSTSSLPDDLPRVLICIGGPYSNETTKTQLASYCPGFHSIGNSYTQGFASGGRKFLEDEDNSWAYIARLSIDVTEREGEIILLWGSTALATATAAYYFAKESKKLTDIGHSSIFVALSVNRHLGYRSIPAKPVDITSTALASKAHPGLTLLFLSSIMIRSGGGLLASCIGSRYDRAAQGSHRLGL